MKLFLVFSCFLASTFARNFETRIIGGNSAVAGQFPFAAAIHITTADGRYFCGGTLISNQWVLTSAQCADGGILFSIQVGSNTLTGTDSNRVTVATSEYFLHPDYNPGTLENDVALIKLRIPVQFTNYLHPVTSLASQELPDGTILAVVGWGQTSDEDAALSESLRFASVTSLTNEECRLTYGNQITDNMVCVEGNYNQGSCNGDTGGPLVRVVLAGNAQLVGVSSFLSGNGCESPDPSGYTRVFPYIGWINNVTEITVNN